METVDRILRRRLPGVGNKLVRDSVDEQPFRAELFSVSQLERHAKAMAASHELARGGKRWGLGRDRLLPRLSENEAVLGDAYDLIADAVKRGRRITPAAEWFLDNYHLIEEQIRTARRHLPRGYSRELPRLASSPLAGFPRVYAIALELISHVDGRVDAESLRAFVASYESVTPLRLGELWAIPIMLRLALLENLRRVAVRLAAGRRDRERAGYWVDRMLEVAGKDSARVVLVLADMVEEDPPLTNAFVAELATRLHSQGTSLGIPMTWLEQRLAEQSETMEHVFQAASQNQAADQVSIGNSITSLRFLGATEWRKFVEMMSEVERTLEGDPAGVYSKMDFETRDQYRHAVEALARRSRLSEGEVAAKAIALARNEIASSSAIASSIATASSTTVYSSSAQSGNGTPGATAHVGYFLIDRGRKHLDRAVGARHTISQWLAGCAGKFPLAIYLGSIALITAIAAALVLWWGAAHGAGMGGLILLAPVAAIVASQLALAVVHWIATNLIHPRILPRLDFSEGIPAGHNTIVAVPTMLTQPREVDDLLEALEVRFLANRDPSLCFALLTDFRDAPQEKLPEDDALLEQAKNGINALNAKYAGSEENLENGAAGAFMLFHRARRWNAEEGVWMGWERKRGKLEEFNAALRGAKDKFQIIVGSAQGLTDIKYVITLDTDTQLPRDSAWQLVGAIAHPLNRPRYDERLGRVTEGYSILQPRVGISMPSARRSGYARLFAGEPGIDPYTRTVSDVYQDVFGEGSFIGKGIYDVDAFEKAVGGRFPDNRILSHDLLEGAFARAGLVTDVLLFEEFPAAYPADISRRHRWIRGDWQILPWLVPQPPAGNNKPPRSSISGLSRWKILDNIRRSLVPIALYILLVAGIVLPGGPLFYAGVVVVTFLFPSILTGLAEVSRRPGDVSIRQHLQIVCVTVARQIMQEALSFAWLPYEAYISAEAIVRTLMRMFVTHRSLLEWRTAREAQYSASIDLAGFYTSMWALPVTAVGLILVTLAQPAISHLVPLLAGLWLISPLVAWRLSRPICQIPPQLSEADMLFLSTIARRTWRFFEAFVGPIDNFLPPDNFQEDPPQGIAHRTSPTNIGLALLANLAAYDFGYIAAATTLKRTAQTFATLDKLRRHNGHFYNWYDTRTLAPLAPLYVSTVDSGNLAGHLLTLAAGLEEMGGRKILLPACFTGLAATLEIVAQGNANRSAPGVDALVRRMRDHLRAAPRILSVSYALLRQLAVDADELLRAVEPVGDADMKWAAQALLAQCRDSADDLSYAAPWVDLIALGEAIWQQGNDAKVKRLGALRDSLRTLDEIPAWSDAAKLELTLLPLIDAALADVPAEEIATAGNALGSTRKWLDQLRAAVVVAAEHAAERVSEAQQLAIRSRELADIDYSFLYDQPRHLLAIGYNVAEHRLDASYYDLLASEARLASYIAIAHGKLPQEHWFSLGRLLTTAAGRPTLLSWSGSMFEYLMPLLVMPTYQSTLLDETYRAVVARQIEYGRERGVPWGISESGYHQTDAQLNYQYRAFGVPGLGFKRGLADDLVIAPYASAMALMVDPKSSCANLRRLAQEKTLGAYGFYEAIDYTPSRLPPDLKSVTIKSFMAHHQGMTFLSLAYLLLERPMQRRFESDPAFRATDLLLQERVPKSPSVYPHPAEVSESHATLPQPQDNLRIFKTANTPLPEVHLLSNGRYHVAVTTAGGGYSRWRDLAVTRWHEDATRDCWGSFCYLRDVQSGDFWSVAHQPTLKQAASYEAIYSQGRAEYRRRDGEIHTHVEISVSPEDDIELRRVNITNRGRESRTIELTSYAEVVLATPAADAAHPAFSNLFVQTQLIRPRQAILCTRRPRSAAERPPWMLHLMTVIGASMGEASYETARADFIGRGRSISDPAAMYRPKLSDSEGSVLDPIVAIRNTLVIAPDQTVQVNFVTGMAETREAAIGLIEKYHDHRLADRVFELAWTHSQVVLRQLDAAEADTRLYGRLASSVLYADSTLRAAASVIAKNRRGQSGLWGYGISGDLPIVLVRIGDQAQINLVRQLVGAHAYWRVKGLPVDLVIWNEDQSGYRQILQDLILSVIASRAETGLIDKPGGIFVRRSEQMSEEDKGLMLTVARVVVSDTAGSLAEQTNRRPRAEATVAPFRALRLRRAEIPVAAEIVPHDLTLYNGTGGFTRDGREYVITTTADNPTPAPWVNVLANPFFGTVLSESGGAYTWCENAQSFRLTPWYNDWIGDTSGEAFYIRDESSGRCWSPTPLPARGPMPYTTRHGFGYSVFEYSDGGITTEMRVYVAVDAPVKFITLKVMNASGRPRRISLTGFFELMLGDRRATNAQHVVSEVDPKTGALLARNSYNSEFSERFAFLDCSEARRTVTGDRTEFLGRNGSPAAPASMMRSRLSGRVGAGLDPCLAMQVMLDLAEGQEREVTFIFGSGRDLADARNLIARFRGAGAARGALEAVWEYWNRTLGAVYVETPDTALNFMVNGWLLYQTLACRIWARSGFYQSGGAYGFRDQLQDVMALTHAEPAILRAQLLRSASRQFREGDVQHWWHPPAGRGVRTRISDDYLWLPYVTCHYVAALSDVGVLDEKINFLEGRPVKPDEESYYDLPNRSDESATLYEHCVRAIKNGLRFGEHGLPLMGCGDWNDGMNLVGEHGKGESVWLGFFLYDVLLKFAPIARQRQDAAFADECTEQAARLRENLDQHAWDGQWYRRAYFDNGEPLGSALNPECKIDSIAQSWSVLSRAGEPSRALAALEELNSHLVKRDLKVIQLLDPPFDTSHLNPGYIKGYVPGVRENGGQYTHAAIWAVMAFAQAGNIERAWELFNLINPLRHGDTQAAVRQYKVEPYVVAADVYTNPQHAGRGGWTWYTGSAGWMYRLIIESLLGLRLEVNRLKLSPLIPADWKSFTIHYRYRETFHHIHVRNLGQGKTVTRVDFDGVDQPDKTIPLVDDRREHHAEVDVGMAG